MEKYGFIYLWFDRKRKMFYVGSHWGTETDGYICSSNRMRDAYRRRPNDFKRRILEKVTDRNILLDIEHKWLSMILEEELGKKYYNLRKHKWGHWATDTESRESISEIISKQQKDLVDKGIHQWLGENNPSIKSVKSGTHRWLTEEHKKRTREIQYERVSRGEHPFLGGEISRKTNEKRVKEKTHNFLHSESRKEIDEKRCDTWEITYPNGEVIIIKNLTSFCRNNNLNQGAMNQVGLGRVKHHKGFRCKKLEKGEIRGKMAKKLEMETK